MTLDLEALRALEAVVKEGGFAKAAVVLNKAQSAVSYQVRKLEQALGVTLLDRGAYRATLTPAGETLLAEGQRILNRARHLEDLAHQFASGWEPRLALVIDGILPLEPIMTALKCLADEQVPTRIQVKVEFLQGVQYRFDKDEADLMLVKDYQPSPNLCATALPEVECVLCAARDHALATGAVDLTDLQQHVELSVQDSSDHGDDRHMFGGERVFYLSGFVLKKQALRMGLGFGWMPLYLIESDLAVGDLVELDYARGSRYRFTPHLVTRRDRPLGRTGQRLADHLSRAITDTVG
jgi:DNA-binding transcriptional LysR family regulator